MKKNMPVLIAVGIIILIVVLAVAMSRKTTTTTIPGGKKIVSDPMQRQRVVKAEMQQAQAAYDAKDYKKAIATTQGILNNVDNMSQEAKNLLQVSQIAQMKEGQNTAAATNTAAAQPAQ